MVVVFVIIGGMVFVPSIRTVLLLGGDIGLKKAKKNIFSLTPDPTFVPIKFEKLWHPSLFTAKFPFFSLWVFLNIYPYSIPRSLFTPLSSFEEPADIFQAFHSDKLRLFFAWYTIFIFSFPFVLWRLVISPHFGGFPCFLRCCYNALEECCWISLLF